MAKTEAAKQKMKESSEYYAPDERIYEFGFHDGYNFSKKEDEKIFKVEVVFKKYGKGKNRIVLLDSNSGNIAFASFGEKDTSFEYLLNIIKKQNENI